MSRGRTHAAGALAAVLLAVAVSGCASNGSYRRGETFARAGDWDAAVAYYTRAVQADPDRPDYKIALERAMQTASNVHLDKARELDRKGELENALVEYRKVLEYAPGNSHAIMRRGELERQLREKADASRTPAKIDAMRERARRQTEGPILNPTSKAPLTLNFATNTAIQDILKFIGDITGINVVIEQAAQSVVVKPTTLSVSGVTVEQALSLVMTANQLWYKVINERTILVIQDNAQQRTKYEDQIIRTFYVSHADPQEIYNLVNQIVRIQGLAIQPAVTVNKTANTITVRGTPNIVNILEKVIQSNDRPRAEIIIDVELLEVNRTRVKELGLNLSQYQIGAIFSPEGAPGGSSTDGEDGGATTGGSTFNLNTISQGISTADFYLTVPQAIVKFLASDNRTRVLAKPQLRGAEGSDLELNLGEEIPVPSTVFGGLGAGGVNTIPISSFTYKNVGVNVKMKPRVTFENEIILEIEIENSTLGNSIDVAGQSLPTFGSRKVKTRMRLREGESNLLAGLVSESDRKVLRGVPGLMKIPILKDILGGTEETILQTDIVILLTPRIVRTHELTQEHLNPIYIGSQMNLGLSGPSPVIGADPLPAVPADAPAAAPGAPAGVLPSNAAPTTGGVTSTPGVAPAAPPPGTPPPPGATATPPPNPPAFSAPSPAFTSPVPGSAPTPVPPNSGVGTPPSTPAPVPAEPAPAAPEPPAPATPPAATPQVSITTPGPAFQVGGGPYTVPLAITNASRLSLMSLTLTYNPALVRVRSVQEGPFFRQGGATQAFNHQIDANAGRVDISVTRAGDQTGASGAGLLASLVFDAVAPGTATFGLTGVTAQPDGRTVPVTFIPATVTVR